MRPPRLVRAVAALSCLLPVAAAGATAGVAPEGACALLASEEIEAVQGDKVLHAKPSAPDRPGLEVAQCFFTTETFANSVSLEVTRPPGGAGPAALAVWERSFGAGEDGREAGERGEGPLPVAGLGDEAFWSADGAVGALYVRRGEAFFRLSLGGAGDAESRRDRTRELARRVLDRL